MNENVKEQFFDYIEKFFSDRINNAKNDIKDEYELKEKLTPEYIQSEIMSCTDPWEIIKIYFDSLKLTKINFIGLQGYVSVNNLNDSIILKVFAGDYNDIDSLTELDKVAIRLMFWYNVLYYIFPIEIDFEDYIVVPDIPILRKKCNTTYTFTGGTLITIPKKISSIE